MKKIFMTLILCAGFSAAVFSQKDAKVKEILDKSSEAFKQSGNVSAYFTMNVRESGSKATESFDGQIYIKGNKIKIDAPGYEIYFDGKTQWVYNKEPNEVNISEPEEDEIQILNPSMIYEIYKKGCNYKYSGAKTDIKMRKVQEVILKPKDKKNDIKEVVLQINDKDYLPVFFHVYFKKNDLENIIHINKYDTKQNFSDDFFVFDATKYPDVEIIDLR
jgi:outer membrane lipoprotein-sorting protein